MKWPVDGGWAVLGGKARLSDINRHRSQMASNLPPSLPIFLKWEKMGCLTGGMKDRVGAGRAEL